MNLNELLNKVNKNEAEYDLGYSDFARTISTPSNGVVDIQLMQRNTIYNECIIVGNQNISSGTKGIVLFVSKAKYPCFIPIYFANDSFIKVPDGSVSIKTVKPSNEKDYPKTGFINLRPYMKEHGLTEGVHFKFRDGSPEGDQWGTTDTISSITNIIKKYFELTQGKIKLVPGDIGQVQGGTFQKHEGVGHATGRGIDMYLSNGMELNSNVTPSNKQIILDLFDIYFSNGVVAILWIPPAFFKPEIEKRYGGRIHYSKNHHDHFHVSFISSPF